MIDSNDVMITIRTSSINTLETDQAIDKFVDAVIILGRELTKSVIEIDVEKHRIIKDYHTG